MAIDVSLLIVTTLVSKRNAVAFVILIDSSFLQQKAPFNESRIYKSPDYYIYEYDIQNYFKPSLIGELKKKYKNISEHATSSID